jgi:hypothetical protein
MKRRSSTPAPDQQWHLSPVLLVAYANGQAGPADAWSAEAHLVSCSLCRAELALALRPTQRVEIDQVRGALLSSLPAQPRPRSSRLRAMPPLWRLVLQPPAILTVLLVLGMALLLNAVWLHVSRSDAAGGGILWLVAPVLPLGGVALCSVGERDPWREAVLAAPSAGLRLILWRTAAVLAVALPSATAAGLAFDAVGPALWLLPCLALTTTALALGTLVGLERASGVVAGLWCALALGPALMRSGGSVADAFRQQLVSASYSTSTVFSTSAQELWVAVALTALAVLVLRRNSYQQLPRAVGKRAT